MFILGEILSFVAALLLAYSTFSKNKRKMMLWQSLNAIFCCLADLVLGGYSAVVTNFFTFFRNILVVKKKLNKRITIVLCLCSIIMGVYFNNRAWIGLLPIVASVQYTLCIYLLKTAQQTRIALVINLFMWMIFDFTIKAYPMFILDIIIIVVTSINIYKFRNYNEETDSIQNLDLSKQGE